MQTVAIKLNAHNLDLIIRTQIPVLKAGDFALALLTSTYNGENWYYVSGNLSEPFGMKYEKQILRESELRGKFDIPAIDNDLWFTVNTK